MNANVVGRQIKWHELKTWPEVFGWSLSGTKMFEARMNDRDFMPGDFLLLREWNPITEKYTGRSISRQILYILEDGQFGLPQNMVIMQLAMA